MCFETNYPTTTQQSLYPNLQQPKSEPCDYQKIIQSKYDVQKFINVRNFILHKTISPHVSFQLKLWIANCFIIPLIVYPIIALIGHIKIEEDLKKWRKAESYLNDQKLLTRKSEYTLEASDIKELRKIFGAMYEDYNKKEYENAPEDQYKAICSRLNDTSYQFVY